MLRVERRHVHVLAGRPLGSRDGAGMAVPIEQVVRPALVGHCRIGAPAALVRASKPAILSNAGSTPGGAPAICSKVFGSVIAILSWHIRIADIVWNRGPSRPRYEKQCRAALCHPLADRRAGLVPRLTDHIHQARPRSITQLYLKTGGTTPLDPIWYRYICRAIRRRCRWSWRG